MVLVNDHFLALWC